MAKDVSKITLGTGDLYINDIDVGYLKGDVEFHYVREKLDFKPSGSLGPVASFVIGETAELRASEAEFKLENLKLALGIEEDLSSFSGDPSYNPASYDAGDGVHKSLTFGGSTAIDDSLAIRFEHIRPETGKKVVVILYTAVSLSDLTLAFHEADFNLTDIAFRGMADTSRPKGDQIGMLLEEK